MRLISRLMSPAARTGLFPPADPHTPPHSSAASPAGLERHAQLDHLPVRSAGQRLQVAFVSDLGCEEVPAARALSRSVVIDPHLSRHGYFVPRVIGLCPGF